IGDSFLYAAKNPDAEVLHKRCEKVLAGGRPGKLRALDLACPGWGTHHERAAFHYCGAATQPDVVVLCFFVGNDVCETILAVRPDDGDGHAVISLGPDRELVLERRRTRLHMKVLRCSKLFRLWETTSIYQAIAHSKKA